MTIHATNKGRPLSVYRRNYETVVITGGTGSFGQAMTKRLLGSDDGPRVRVFSRDEDKQERMRASLPPGDRLSYLLGDVRDQERLVTAFDGASEVVHSAALKRVMFGEQHVDEFTKTNVIGSRNVVTAAIQARVERTLLISTDKACAPFGAYGKTKALAEDLFRNGNQLGVSRGARFAAVRGGNIWRSRGSVVDVWQAAIDRGEKIQVTDPDMTRFTLAMGDWVAFAERALAEMRGGEIFVPKPSAYRLGDLAAVMGSGVIVAGHRSGEKLHEALISPQESARTVDIGWAYVIEPPPEMRAVWNYKPWEGTRLTGIEHTSDRAPRLTCAELAIMLAEGAR